MMKTKFIKTKTDRAELSNLIDKYYEGISTVDEERRLCSLLSDNNLPKEFEADKAILQFFGNQKVVKKAVAHLHFIRYSAAAAILIVALISTKMLYSGGNESYAYINGEKVTDVNTLRKQALASLDVVAHSQDDVKNCLKNVSSGDLIREQLDVFSELP